MAEAASVGFSHLVDEATNVTELRILEKRDPHYAVRIKRMAELNDAQQDMVAYCLNKSHFFKTMGDKWKVWGDLLYATQVTGSAIVPVLIGVLGSFDSAFIDACIRVLAIVLSLAAAICAALARACTPIGCAARFAAALVTTSTIYSNPLRPSLARSLTQPAPQGGSPSRPNGPARAPL